MNATSGAMASKSPTPHLCIPRPVSLVTPGLLVLPLVAVVEQMIPGLVGTAVIACSHHQQWSSDLFFIRFKYIKYTPVRGSPDLSW